MSSTTGQGGTGWQPGQRPHPAPGPGVAWLAQRTGMDAGELTGSPTAAAAAVRAAARETAALAAALQSPDPAVRAAAHHEAGQLLREFERPPLPGETLRRRVAALLRESARQEAPPGGRSSL